MPLVDRDSRRTAGARAPRAAGLWCAAACALLAACATAPAEPAAPPVVAAAAPKAGAGGNMADFPTSLRVEYVMECININGGAFVLLYQCSCAFDRIAANFTHDEFVEASTFAKYAGLAGERGGEFRDSDHARDLTRKFRTTQAAAYKSCNVTPVARPR